MASPCLVEFFAVIGPDLEGESLASTGQPELTLHAQLLHSYPQEVRGSIRPESLPPLCFPRGVEVRCDKPNAHGFETVLTDAEGRRLYAAILIVARRVEGSDRWTSTALCVVSQYALLAQHRAFLAQLVRISRSRPPCCLESFIATYCCETPVPPRGMCRVLVSLGDTSLWLARPAPNELPHCDVANFQTLFDECLSAANIVLVWSLLLIEVRVALASKHIHKFGRASLGLLALLFPFEWRGAMVPVCPAEAVEHVIEAPVPFLAGGLDTDYLRTVPVQDRPSGVVFVDLDRDEVHLGDVPPPVLPTRHAAKLIKRLNDIAAEWRAAKLNFSTSASLLIASSTKKSSEDLLDPPVARQTSSSSIETSPSTCPLALSRSSTVECSDPPSADSTCASGRRSSLGRSDSAKDHRSAARDSETNFRKFGISRSLDDVVLEWSSVDGLLIRDLETPNIALAAAGSDAGDNAASDNSSHLLHNRVSSSVRLRAELPSSSRRRHWGAHDEDDDLCAQRSALLSKITRDRRDAFLRFLAATMLGYRHFLLDSSRQRSASPVVLQSENTQRCSELSPATSRRVRKSSDETDAEDDKSKSVLSAAKVASAFLGGLNSSRSAVLQSFGGYSHHGHLNGFDVERFVNSRDATGRQWVAQLTSTQMFAAFTKEAHNRRRSTDATFSNHHHDALSAEQLIPPTAKQRNRSVGEEDIEHGDEVSEATTGPNTVPAWRDSAASGKSAGVRTARIHLDAVPVRDDATATDASDALLLFDETCSAKLNRHSLKLKHHSTPFLRSTRWRIDETYLVPAPSGVPCPEVSNNYSDSLISLRAERYPPRHASRCLISGRGHDLGRNARDEARLALARLLRCPSSGNLLASGEAGSNELLRCCVLVQALIRMIPLRAALHHSRRAAVRIQASARRASAKAALAAVVSAAAEAVLDTLFEQWRIRRESLIQRSRCVSFSALQLGAPPCLGLALRLDELLRIADPGLRRRAFLDVTNALRPSLARGGTHTLLAAATSDRIDTLLFPCSAGDATSVQIEAPTASPKALHLRRGILNTTFGQSSSLSSGGGHSMRSPSGRAASSIHTFHSSRSSQASPRKLHVSSLSGRSQSSTTELQHSVRLFTSTSQAKSNKFIVPPELQVDLDPSVATTEANHHKTPAPRLSPKSSRQQLQQIDVYEAVKNLNPDQRNNYFESFRIFDDRRRKRKLAKVIWQHREHALASASLILLFVESGLNGDAALLTAYTPADRHREARLRLALLSTARAGLSSLQRASCSRN